MWELEHKEGWALKNWCFQTVVLEKTLESPSNCKIKPVNLKGNQCWIFIGRTDAEAEAPVLWSPDVKNWRTFHWKRPRCWERLKAGGEGNNQGWDGCIANSMEFEQAPGVGDGQESLACCRPWGYKEWDMIEQLNWTEWQKQCIWLYHLLWEDEKITNLIYPVS